MILLELRREKELTATQIAHRLGLTPNNVYHHMRVLLRLGVVDPPRPVPGETYVEKYYQLKPDIRAAMRLDREWFDRVQPAMTAEDRKEVLITLCLTMAHLLRQAARRYQDMDAESFDQLAHEQQLVMLSINEISRERLKFRLQALGEVLEEEQKEFPTHPSPPTDLVLIASLPAMWDISEDEET
jgi:DNA-binding transcriptional ArsR family regulator